MGAAEEDVARAEEGMRSASESAKHNEHASEGDWPMLGLTLLRDDKVASSDVDGLGLDEKALVRLVDLRVGSLDSVERGLGTESLKGRPTVSFVSVFEREPPHTLKSAPP